MHDTLNWIIQQIIIINNLLLVPLLAELHQMLLSLRDALWALFELLY